MPLILALLRQSQASFCEFKVILVYTPTKEERKKEKIFLLSFESDMMVHTFDPSTREVEAGRSVFVRSQPGLSSMFQDEKLLS